MHHYYRSLKSSAVALSLAFFTFFTPLAADDSPKEDPQRLQLFEELSKAGTEEEGRAAEKAVWTYWFDQAPSPRVRAALDAGMERREAYDYEAAEDFLDEVVNTAPDYAEGYNQRAFVRFLRQKYSLSRDDLEKTLELVPDHFGAMSGLFHILRIDNRSDAALGVLKQAVTIHPWLKERHALPEALWPESYRDLHEKGTKL